MTETPTIRFNDGASYQEFMGKWSLLAGDTFLDWLAPSSGLRWLDVGCGNGAFTELIVTRCGPAQVEGIDPSEEQLAFARERFPGAPVAFRIGDAMELPYPDAAFDAAVMALVIFFVPDPAKGVAEMARVVRPGGSVSSYGWDFFGGGFPFAALQEEISALGRPPLLPPSVDASRIDAMRTLWIDAGIVDIETRTIEVERTFADFESFWTIARAGPAVVPRLTPMPDADIGRLKERLRERLVAAPDGTITYSARANAIKGTVPI
jgi:SAM-dependent methyltransferase